MGIASYRTQRIETASPHQILVMLLQELLRRVELGASEIEGGSVTNATTHFHKSREILTELLASLDPVAGAEPLVQNLKGLYKWSAAELVAASRERDAAKARRVGQAIEPLLEGYRELLFGGTA